MPKTSHQIRVTIPMELMPIWEAWCKLHLYTPYSQDPVVAMIRAMLADFESVRRLPE